MKSGSAIVSLFVVLCAATAMGQAQEQTSSAAPPGELTAVQVVKAAPQGQLQRFSIAPELLQKRAKELRARLPRNDDLCYTMNSYVFARHGQGDATRLVVRRTCTAASLFKLKPAPAKPKE